jgi:hypothetical protein
VQRRTTIWSAQGYASTLGRRSRRRTTFRYAGFPDGPGGAGPPDARDGRLWCGFRAPANSLVPEVGRDVLPRTLDPTIRALVLVARIVEGGV